MPQVGGKARRINWRAVASDLARAIPLDRLHPRVRDWVARAGRARMPWYVAVSGGADSLALLLLLWAHWPDRRNRLVVLHFNHRLRGRASAADARFCAGVCRSLGIPLRVGRWEKVPRTPSEAAAREARMAFFYSEMGETRRPVLWLGHHQDDVAETALMRLARGSGTAGLAAPRPVHRVGENRTHLRPLLSLRKEALTAALRGLGVAWREDSSNSGPAFFRNRLRNKVVREWVAAAGRDAVRGAVLSRERLEEDDDALDCWLNELAPIRKGGALDLNVLAGRPLALWRRALHRWLLLQPHGSDLSRHGFEDLLSKATAGKATRFSLGAQGFARIRSGRMIFERR